MYAGGSGVKKKWVMLLRFVVFTAPVMVTWVLFILCYLLAFGWDAARTVAKAILEVEA